MQEQKPAAQMPDIPDIFDRIANQATDTQDSSLPKGELVAQEIPESQIEINARTARNACKALQYLLANGWLETAQKAQLYRFVAA